MWRLLQQQQQQMLLLQSSLSLSFYLRRSTICAASPLLCPVRGVTQGWSYEHVDPTTGRTPLDELYDKQQERIQAVFENPLPPMPRDGNINPDFLVGFAHYQYRLRDQYRAVLAGALDVPLSSLQLSVAWSGRFDVTRFNRVRKVCGVCITANHTNMESNEKEKEELQQRIKRVVRTINERASERLLALHLVQASEAIPEVQFAAAERENAAAERIYKWMREYIVKPHIVVVLYGANRKNSAEITMESKEIERQRIFIEEKWMKAFFHRRIIPHVLSFGDLTQLLHNAVQKGEVTGITVEKEPTETNSTSTSNNSNSNNNNTKTDTHESHTNTSAPDAEEKMETVKVPPLKNTAAWEILLRKAVFRRHEDRAIFPVLFVHGECAGGAEEMRYLLQNREALDAVLLHPNDVAFKKKFMSRFRASHSRLQMAEEMAP